MAPDATTLLDTRYGERLKGLRDSRGMTQAELVERMKKRGIQYMNGSTLSRIEAGTRPVRLSEAQVISRVFQVSLESMTTDFESLAFYESRHRMARIAFVKFRDSATDVARWKLELEGYIKGLEAMLDESTEEALTNAVTQVLVNIRDYIQTDLVEEARSLESETRDTYERQHGSRAGRFLNSRI